MTAPRWRLRLLGALLLEDGRGGSRRLPTRAAARVLARLALAPARRHPREELIELLWPGVEAEAGRNRLRQTLSVLRAVLDTPAAIDPAAAPAAAPVLQADRQAVWLAEGSLTSDVAEGLAALERGLDETPAAQALALGAEADLMPGFFDEWVVQARTELAARAAALRRRRHLLPSSAARDLAALPQYLTRWIGVEAEAAELAARLRSARLVLLRGPGGAGKTRLAVEVARTLAPEFEQLRFVPLAAARTREQMLAALLHALGLEAPTGAAGADALAERIGQALEGRRALIVLDNFEQLVEAARGDLQRWLTQRPGLHLLVTSRRALALDGEVELPLGPLPLPEPDLSPEALAANPAVHLFADRAAAVLPGFRVDGGNALRVAELVRALHGLPLALELAAARLRGVPLAELHRLLVGAHGAPALALLASPGPRAAADERHASLEQVLRWSWMALDGASQRLLARLAVCDGGASLALLVNLCHEAGGATAAVLRAQALVESSVAYRRDEPAGGRWFAYEPMRDFIALELGPGAEDEPREALAAAMAAWARALPPEGQLAALRSEWLNLLAALEHGAGAAPAEAAARALDTVLALRPALHDKPLPAATLVQLRRAAARVPGHRPIAVQGLLAQQSFRSGEPEAAAAHAAAVLERLERPADGATEPEAAADRVHARLQAARARLRLAGGHDRAAVAQLRQALAEARALGEHDIAAHAHAALAVALYRQDRQAPAAAAEAEQALALWRRHGPAPRITEGLVNLAILHGFQRRPALQLELLELAEASARRHGQEALLAFVLSVTGYVLADLRRWNDSAARYRACLQGAWQHGQWREWFYALWNLPRTLACQGRPEAAARLMGFAEAFHRERFGGIGPEDGREKRRTRRLLRAAGMRGAEIEAGWLAGAQLDVAAAMAFALAQTEPAAPAEVTN